jgi:hypothetical protein
MSRFEVVHDQIKESIRLARTEGKNTHDGYWVGYVLGMIAARTFLTEFEEAGCQLPADNKTAKEK